MSDALALVCSRCWQGGEELTLGGGPLPTEAKCALCGMGMAGTPRSEYHVVWSSWLTIEEDE